MQDRVDADVVRKDLGKRFELLNLSYKPYPCNRGVHCTIDAVLELRAKTQRPASDIESISVGITGSAYQMICVPEHVRMAPKTIVEAQFSMHYALALSWIDGAPGMRHFSDEALQRSDILALAARVKPYVDEDIDREWSRSVTPARVMVRFRDGQTVETRVDYPKGHPKNMMTDAEFLAKTTDCATYAARPLPPDTVGRLISTVGKLESLPDISELLRIVT
jgi:2-methylcitrate dehydratase PrpD